MDRHPFSPSTALAMVAVLVVVAGGSAAAATAITGAQIKDRSITRVDIAKDTLTGQEISESKLGAVPNAKRFGGVLPGGYLRSSRIRSATVSILGPGSTRVLTDKRLGLRVLYTPPAKLTLRNLNSSATLHYGGVGYFTTSNVYGSDGNISPSTSVNILFDAVGFFYGDFLITKLANQPGRTKSVRLSCTLEDSVAHVFSCQAVG